MITLNTNKQGISLAAKAGDVLWINKLVNESVLKFADVVRESVVLTMVTFTTDALVTITGLHANGTAAVTELRPRGSRTRCR